jgi:hypothetical protein
MSLFHLRLFQLSPLSLLAPCTVLKPVLQFFGLAWGTLIHTDTASV